MVFFAAALLGFFWLVPQHFSRDAPGPAGLFKVGLVAVCLVVLVALTPSEVFGKLHANLALIAGLLGIAAGATAVQIFLAAKNVDTLLWLGVLTVLAVLLAAGIFVVYLGDPAPPLLVPATQKAAAVLLCSWIAAVALRVLMDNYSRGA